LKIASADVSTILPSPNDDVQREVSFYTQTLQNVQKAIDFLAVEGLEKPRPNDFLAEMYKSDQVMQKVRSRLVKQQVKIQNFEEKKMREQNRKFNKQV
jgi:rRNA-processing protein EBP2